MTNISTNDFKSGLKVILDGSPMVIVENEFVKPGKGQAFNRIKLKNLYNNRVIERTFKSGEKLELADILEITTEYLYYDGEFYIFINNNNFEQYHVKQDVLNETKKWLKAQEKYDIIIFNSNVIQVSPPNFVELKIMQTEPGIKGDTVGTGGKIATLETGAKIKVPFFIKPNTIIKIDTRTDTYVSRVKE